VLALVLLISSQVGEPRCISVDGSRLCGYDCKDIGGRGACAKTPAGVCEVGVGPSVVCFDPPAWLTQVTREVPRPKCLWRGSNVACGYDCKAQGIAVACAQTPRGKCIADYDRVVCADPPAAVYGVWGPEAPRPTCVAKDSMLACGYGCASTGVDLACAKTPLGVCAERGGKVTCFDPDERVICAGGKDTPKPTCKAGQGSEMICGYQCTEGGGTASCAKTPAGRCDGSGMGAPVCFDPPVQGGEPTCLGVLGAR
jgi:hypothetical protein